MACASVTLLRGAVMGSRGSILQPARPTSDMARRGPFNFAPILLWLAAIAVAAVFDSTVAAWMHGHGTDTYLKSHKLLREALKLPGYYAFTVALAVGILLLHSMRWRAAIFLLIGTALSGLNYVIKWIVGRARPFKSLSDSDIAALLPFYFHPLPGGIEGLCNVKNLCFPSGHASLAFATAAAMSILL